MQKQYFGIVNPRVLLFAGAGAAVLATSGAMVAQAQQAGGPVTYWMTADTNSGMGAMSAGGSAGMMRAMMGGGQQASYSHNLMLQLGSGRRAPGAPTAEHLPPAGLQAGPSLPLLTPQGTAAPQGPSNWTGRMEKPKGRMLIYWGCGAQTRPGQPVVIDFAAMSAGKTPPAFASFQTLSSPAAGKHATYGEWPNERTKTHVPAGGSLVGAHVVRGNYTPDINFTLGQGQDFLAPVVISGNEAGPGGAIPLAWRSVAGSKAWFASTMGAASNGDFIMWSSSETKAMPMAMSHLAQSEIARLVQQKVLMGPQATSCTIPAEVAKAAPQSMLMLTALGGEANFSHPARPAKAAASWRPEWTVKLLTKSTYTGMLGMDMAAMMNGGADRGDEGEAEAPDPEVTKKQRKKDLIRRGIGSILGQ